MKTQLIVAVLGNTVLDRKVTLMFEGGGTERSSVLILGRIRAGIMSGHFILFGGSHKSLPEVGAKGRTRATQTDACFGDFWELQGLLELEFKSNDTTRLSEVGAKGRTAAKQNQHT